MVGAELEPGVLSAGSSSFVVVDFFDFESQATPLLPGVSPAFDFATTFKVSSVGDRDENVRERENGLIQQQLVFAVSAYLRVVWARDNACAAKRVVTKNTETCFTSYLTKKTSEKKLLLGNHRRTTQSTSKTVLQVRFLFL